MSMMVQEVRRMEARAVAAAASAAVATAEAAVVEAGSDMSSSGIAADHMAYVLNFPRGFGRSHGICAEFPWGFCRSC